MFKSADLHETIFTPVICHKHVRYHDGVTLHFSMKFPSVAPNKTRNGHFSIYRQISAHSEVKTTKKKKGKAWFNVRKHWEPKSINRNLSAAALHLKPSCSNSNLNDNGISLQWVDSGICHFLVTGTEIFRIIWKILENLYKIWWGDLSPSQWFESINVSIHVLIKKIITTFGKRDLIKS